MTTRAISASTPKLIHSGFTLVEFLITVAALTFVFLIAGPSVSDLLQQRQVKQASGDIFDGLTMAKIEAVKRHSTVRLCPSSDGLSCRNDGDWNKGWMIFADGNDIGSPDRIEILESFDSPDDGVRIQASGVFSGTAAFTLAGVVANNNATTGTFTICPSGAESGSRMVVLDQDGLLQRVRTENSCTSD